MCHWVTGSSSSVMDPMRGKNEGSVGRGLAYFFRRSKSSSRRVPNHDSLDKPEKCACPNTVRHSDCFSGVAVRTRAFPVGQRFWALSLTLRAT